MKSLAALGAGAFLRMPEAETIRIAPSSGIAPPGKGPSGPAYKVKIQVMYDPAAKYLTWIETDSRGYTLFKPGAIGADSGGYFTHYFETSAVKAGAKSLHLKGSTFLSSPSNFRIRRALSIDREPYMNIGEMWFRKQVK